MNIVHMPRLIALGTGMTPARARNAIMKGDVYVDGWNIGRPEVDLDRSILANAEIRVKDKTFWINGSADHILRNPQQRLPSLV